jgi:hypothetical protein
MILSAALLAAAAVKTVSPDPLLPAGTWRLATENASCVLKRDFPTPTGKVLLQIERPLLASNYGVKVVYSDRPHAGTVTAVFHNEDGGNEISTEKAKLFETDPWVANLYAGVPAEFLDGLPRSALLRVTVDQTLLARLQLTHFDEARTALGPCLSAMAKRYGIDMDAMARLRTLPKPIGFPWLKIDDYPEEAFFLTRMSVVRLSVGADGRPVDCTTVQSSSSEKIDRYNCELMMKRARFEPATDASGAPVATQWVQALGWQWN